MAKTSQKLFTPHNEAYYQSLLEDALDIITVTDRISLNEWLPVANISEA